MTNKLNRQYFETRKKHDEIVSPKAWIYVLPILVFFISIGTCIVDFSSDKTSNLTPKESIDSLEAIQDK